MTVSDHFSVPDLAARERSGTRSPADLAVADRLADLAEADRLISDLAALLDAGLVVVHEHVVGPARYGVGTELGDAA